MSKKGSPEAHAESQKLRSGAPDIAHPDDGEKWERQTELITAFLFEMWERVEARDKKAAREARAKLQTFFLNSIGQSLRVALDDKDGMAKQWASNLLADVFVSICKHIGKVKIEKPYRELMKNAAFRDEKRRIGKIRSDLLFPGMVRAITQRELKKAGHFQKRLLLLSAIDNRKIPETERQRLGLLKAWKEAAKKEGIPEVYWPTVKLPEFSEKHLPQWWKFLWPLIQDNSDKQQLLELAELKYRSARTRYFGDLQKTARDHLKALARRRDEGAFYLF